MRRNFNPSPPSRGRNATEEDATEEYEEEEELEDEELEEEEDEEEEEDDYSPASSRRGGASPANGRGGAKGGAAPQRPPLHPAKTAVPRIGGGRFGAAPAAKDDDEEEEDEEEDDDGAHPHDNGVGFDDDGGEFSQKVIDFLADEEPDMLVEGYAPFAEVAELMGVAEEEGEEAFDEAFEDFKARQEEARQLVFEYVDSHYVHFNKSIAYFSQMTADVYDVEETLEILRNESAEAAECLGPDVEELRVFHDKAMRAAMRGRILTALNTCIQSEHHVASLLQTRRHLTTVKALQQFTSTLQGPLLVDLTCTQRLRQTAATLQATLQRSIRANLHACIFRRYRLQDSIDAVVEDIVASSGRGRNRGNTAGAAERGVGDFINIDVINIQDDGIDDGLSGAGGALGGSGPTATRPEQNYITFIPICVKSLYLMDPRQMARADIIFGNNAAQRELIMDFVTRYLVFYVAWQGKCNRQSDANAISVRATGRVADRLANVVTTVEEAVVKIQAPNVRAFLGVMCKEMSKIVRNADFMVNSLASMEFPFLQRQLMSGLPVEQSPLWDAVHAPTLQAAHDAMGSIVPPLRSLLSHIVGKARVACAMEATSVEDRTAMTSLWQKVDVNTFLLKWGVDPSPNAPEPFVGSVSMMPSLGDFIYHVKDICDHMVIDAAPRISRASADKAALTVAQQLATVLRDTTVRRVADIRASWDVGVLWEHINDALIGVANVLCAVQEDVLVGRGGGGGASAFEEDYISAGAKERPSGVMSTREDHKKGLGDMLYYRGALGGPSFVEDVGRVGFSLTATAAVIWQKNRQAAAQGGMAPTRRDPIKAASAGLDQFLHLTRHNAIVVFGVIDEFTKAVHRRVPALRKQNSCRALAHMQSFVVNTFAPALYGTHAKKLRDKYVPYLPYISPPASSLDPNPPVAEVGCQTAYDPSTNYPLLSAATYVQAVALKVRHLTRGLPKATADDLIARVVNPLTETLLTAARDSITALGLGSFAYRLLHQPFVDAFGKPLEQEPRLWHVMRDEGNIYGAQVATDAKLFAYYEENNKERTSGHHASMNTLTAVDHQHAQDVAALNDLTSLDGVGKIPPQCLRLRSSTAIVGLGLLCHTFEWLGNTLVSLFWDGAAQGTALADMTFTDLMGSSTLGGGGGGGGAMWAARGSTLSQCMVPGHAFMQSFEKAMAGSGGGSAAASVMGAVSRLALLYRQTMTISQAALFLLAVDARFTAFRYLPQLRDEPFTWLATPTAPDAVITQYSRAMLEMSGLLSANLGLEKRQYIALTIASPVGRLLLSEMSLLRDKRITDSGQRRLQNNLLALQSTLQMLCAGDPMVAQAVQEDLLKVSIFFANLRNRDVVNTIVSSGDYKLFAPVEVMNLIALVFRSESSGLLAESVASYQRRVHSIGAKKESVRSIIEGAARQMLLEVQAAQAARAAPPPAPAADSKQHKKKDDAIPGLESMSEGSDGDGSSSSSSSSEEEVEEVEESSSSSEEDASSEGEPDPRPPVVSPAQRASPTIAKPPPPKVAVAHVSESETSSDEDTETEEVEEVEEEEEEEESDHDDWQPGDD